MANKFKTDSKLKQCMDRTDSEAIYDSMKHARESFEVVTGKTDLCGNVNAVFNRNRCKLTNDHKVDHMSYDQISSPLALYRTISLFECGLDSSEVDFYKMNWFVKLKHKETGEILGLGEWKGGFQIFTSGHCLSDLPKEFIKDVEKLLTLIANPKMPIGYDGTVAGTVA